MKRSPYTKHKQSGVEWLGDVPEHWDVKQARRCLLEHKQGYYSTDVYVDDGFKLLRITDLDGNGFVKTDDCPSVEIKDDAVPFLLRDSDFVFARTGGAGSFGLVRNLKEKTVFASYLIRFRFNKKTYVDFLRYNFLSKQFVHGIIKNIHGGVNQNVHAEDIKDQFIPLPPLPEQQAIADFLDRETGRIDTLIGKKQRFVELLKEKRSAMISRAVTKGLNPKVKMKPSGIEWLGNVPEHWEVKRLKYIVRMKSGEGITSEEIQESDGYPVYGGNGLRGYFSAFTHNGHYVLIGRQGALCGNINYGKGKFWASEHAVVADPIKPLATLWLGELLRVMNLNQYSVSAAQPGLAIDKIKELNVPLPPFTEQQAIADHLDSETGKIDALITKVAAAIEKLKEYRTALISAVVTGKIDVREAV